MLKAPSLPSVKNLEVVAFVVGFVILTFELTAARIIAPYLGATIYTWTSIIGVILAALAVGYVLGGILADNRKRADDIVLLLIASAVSVSLVTVSKDGLLGYLSDFTWALQTQSFVASIVLFALPTVLLGAITPYLARLSITDVATSGHRLSRIEAAGTVGSLAGTFLTGYVLFGLIGTRYLLIALAVLTILSSFLLSYRKYLFIRLAVLAAVILAGCFSSKPVLSGFLNDIDTKYNRVIVRNDLYNGKTIRVLQTDSTYQSGVYTDGTPGLTFRYVRAFAYAAKLKPDAKRHLIIGGGAFTFPEFLAREFPKSTVDTVEIDDQLPKISRDYFKFQAPSNLHVIAADGRQFLNNTDTKYDMVFLDAFNSLVPPFQLLTREAAGKMQLALQPDGIVVANIISAASGYQSGLIDYTYSTYKSVFPHVKVYRVTPEYPLEDKQNLLVVAGNQPLDASRVTKIRQARLEFDYIVQSPLNLTYNTGRIMTDDYAPVEALAL